MDRIIEKFKSCLQNSKLDVTHLRIGQRDDRKYFEAFSEKGEHLFIKLQVANDGKSKIELEKEINDSLGYQTYQIPGCEQFTYIATQYFEGYTTLKDVVLSETLSINTKGQCLIKAFEEYIRMLHCVEESNICLQPENWYKLFRRTSIKLLVSSGWNGVATLPRVLWEYYVSACVLFMESLMKVGIIKINQTELISHGDLHWNNIMCKNENVRILDLENTAIGDPNIDVAFLYARLWHYCKKNDKLLEYLNSGLNCYKNTKYFEQKTFHKLITLFKYFVRTNPRFQ